MGGSSSKPLSLPEAPEFDISKATVGLQDVQDYQEQAQESVKEASQAALELYRSSNLQSYGLWILGAICVILAIYVAYAYLWSSVGGSPSTGQLNIESAVFKVQGVPHLDVTQKVINKKSENALHMTVDSSIGSKEGYDLVIKYQYVGGSPKTTTVPHGKVVNITETGQPSQNTKSVSSWWKSETNHLPEAKDASAVSTVPAASAPLSGGKEGSYGYQFWMYIKDWNYKFGQEKAVMSRSDATNSNVMNPNVTLHPTDNSLKISVSIFPSSGSSKAEPAPAGHSGASDDVFTCEVPNIPLQTWVAVSVTVSSRNLDVYLNGKLVKSCLMTGVPKPAAGDIELNRDGGFSGWMCSFYHYARMLQPSDAQGFYSKGVPCSVPDTSGGERPYKVTFGLFDTKGTETAKYVF